LTNVQVMVPFVRTLKQAERVTQLLADHGLKRGVDDLKVIMMCEVPSNAILAEEFLQFFDGFSIGSNDLTNSLWGLIAIRAWSCWPLISMSVTRP
jgi:pyruvate,water dikinase